MSREFYETWARVLKSARVTYRKPHALRHTFASILLSRGANPLYLVRAGGWTNANILFKVYAKWIEEAADSASMSASSGVTAENQRTVELAQV
jgi:integrase